MCFSHHLLRYSENRRNPLVQIMHEPSVSCAMCNLTFLGKIEKNTHTHSRNHLLFLKQAVWVLKSKILAQNQMYFGNSFIDSQKEPKSDFQSEFSMSKIIRIFLFFFSLKNIILGANFSLLTFFDNFNFYSTLFSKMMSNF